MTAGNQPSSSGGAQAIVDRLRAGSKINSGNARPSRIAMKEAADLIEGTFSGAQAAPEPPSNAYASELTADCTKLLPGGTLDDSAYSQIEDALDAIEAPMIDENGRYLTLVERIKALPSCSVPSTHHSPPPLVPDGYRKLPTHLPPCRCPKLWRDENGDAWCCTPLSSTPRGGEA